MKSVARLTATLILIAGSSAAQAHGEDALWGWNVDPWVLLPLALTAALYGGGVRALWRRAGRWRGVGRQQIAFFSAGWLTLLLALASPLDAVAAELFSVHMVQHELLMVVAAPLLIMSRPLGAMAWGVPPRARPLLGRALRANVVERLWSAMTAPMAAWLLHALALWVWHAPALYAAAAASTAVHALQHACFLVAALLFWWAVLGSVAARRRALAVVMLFTTMVHMGVLGALLTLSPEILYRPYVASTLARGLDPLEDQQLGGLLMWIPAGTAYLLAGLLLAVRLVLGPVFRTTESH